MTQRVSNWNVRPSLLKIAFLLSCFGVLAAPQVGWSQIQTWVPLFGGDWDLNTNWSGLDVPDGVGESAVLGGSSAYTVDYDLNTTIDNLTISNSNATLSMIPNSINTSLTVTNGFSNLGTISISSNSGFDSSFFVTNGNLTNNNTIEFGGVASGAATIRRLNADVINDGTVNVIQSARLSRANGVFTNNADVNIAFGRTLDFDSVTGTYNQNAGTTDNQGAFNFVGDTLNFNGGEFKGNAIDLENSTLNIGAGSVGAGTFNMTRSGTYSGDLAAAQTLNILQGSAFNTNVTAGSDFTNRGTVNLDSDSGFDVQLLRDGTITNESEINFGGIATGAATIRRLTADVINNGTVNVNQSARLSRSNGVFTNNSLVNIANDRILDFDSVTGIYNQNGGTTNNQGAFNFAGDTLNFNGGEFKGNAIDLENSTLNIGAGSVGAGTFNMTRSGTYSGDLAAAQTLNILQGSAFNTNVTAGSDFTNRGTINLDSDSGFDVQLLRDGTITNESEINFGGIATGAATIRRLTADVINNGTVNVNQSARLSRSNGVFTNNNLVNIATGKILNFDSTVGVYNQDGGTTDNQGEFRFVGDTLNFNGGDFTGNAIDLENSTLNIGAVSTGSGTFNMRRAGALTGDIAAAQTVNVMPGAVSNATVTAGADFINRGAININSDNAFDAELRREGTLTNEGAIVFGGIATGSSTIRSLTTEVMNSGLIDVAALGVNTRIGIAGADHVNGGMLISRNDGSVVTFLGDSFTNSVTGTLAGVGEFDFTQTGLDNEGTIGPGLSPGTMILGGDVDFASTSVLAIELGGTLQGTEYDFLSVLDSLALDGELSIDFVDGFENSVLNSDTFTIVSANSLGGTFAGLADGSTISDQDGLGVFTVNYVGNDVVLGNFQSVPEPGALLVLAVTGLVCSTRRRRSLI